MILNKCRLCKSKKLFQFLDLGFQPPSDQFKRKVELNNPTIYYPLKVYNCIGCGLKLGSFCKSKYKIPDSPIEL